MEVLMQKTPLTKNLKLSKRHILKVHSAWWLSNPKASVHRYNGFLFNHAFIFFFLFWSLPIGI